LQVAAALPVAVLRAEVLQTVLLQAAAAPAA
jgi:hypothetical protein